MSIEDQDRFHVPDVPSPVCQQTVVGGEMLGTVHGEEEEDNKEKEDPKGEREDKDRGQRGKDGAQEGYRDSRLSASKRNCRMT